MFKSSSKSTTAAKNLEDVRKDCEQYKSWVKKGFSGNLSDNRVLNGLGTIGAIFGAAVMAGAEIEAQENLRQARIQEELDRHEEAMRRLGVTTRTTVPSYSKPASAAGNSSFNRSMFVEELDRTCARLGFRLEKADFGTSLMAIREVEKFLEYYENSRSFSSETPKAKVLGSPVKKYLRGVAITPNEGIVALTSNYGYYGRTVVAITSSGGMTVTEKEVKYNADDFDLIIFF